MCVKTKVIVKCWKWQVANDLIIFWDVRTVCLRQARTRIHNDSPRPGMRYNCTWDSLRRYNGACMGPHGRSKFPKILPLLGGGIPIQVIQLCLHQDVQLKERLGQQQHGLQFCLYYKMICFAWTTGSTTLTWSAWTRGSTTILLCLDKRKHNTDLLCPDKRKHNNDLLCLDKRRHNTDLLCLDQRKHKLTLPGWEEAQTDLPCLDKRKHNADLLCPAMGKRYNIDFCTPTGRSTAEVQRGLYSSGGVNNCVLFCMTSWSHFYHIKKPGLFRKNGLIWMPLCPAKTDWYYSLSAPQKRNDFLPAFRIKKLPFSRKIFRLIFFSVKKEYLRRSSLKNLRIFLTNCYINYRYDRRFTEDLRPPHCRQTNSKYGSLGHQRKSLLSQLNFSRTAFL